MLFLKDISRSFDNNKVLDELTYMFQEGTINTIIAPNGTGKTTLLSIMSGLLIPDKGELIYHNGYSEKDVTLLLSGDSNLYRKNTVQENVYFFAALMGLSQSDIKQNIQKYSEIFPIYNNICDTVVEKLSYGQKRLAALFSAVISESKFILIDEVSEGLDLENVNILENFLETIKKDKVIILASQDYKFAAKVSDKLLFLKDGKIQYEYDELSEEELIQLYSNLYIQ